MDNLLAVLTHASHIRWTGASATPERPRPLSFYSPIANHRPIIEANFSTACSGVLSKPPDERMGLSEPERIDNDGNHLRGHAQPENQPGHTIGHG